MENTDPSEAGNGQSDASNSRIEENVKSRSTWLRLLFMVVCGLLLVLSRLLVFVVVILQFLWLLLSGSPNERLTQAGQSLATYTYQLICYLTFCSDVRPFPFDEDWPSGKPS